MNDTPIDEETGFPCAESDVKSLLQVHDVRSLYYVSFLLTANEQKAKRCFVTGIEDVQDGNIAFREWAHAWARRVIVRNAVSLIKPWKGTVPGEQTISYSGPHCMEDDDRRVSVASIPW